jgi:hypothetical protein
VTRHTVVVVSALLVGTVDHNREFDGPLVTVEFRREVMLNLTTPALREFLLNRAAPLDDRGDVGNVVCLD